MKTWLLFLLCFSLCSQVWAKGHQVILEKYQNIKVQFAEIQEIDSPDLQALLKEKKVFLIDVRSEKERVVSMIPGAMTQEQFEKLTDKEKGSKKIVCYCTIGFRSGKYSQSLQSQGYRVYNLKAGILGWIWKEGDLVDPQGKKIKEVHVYSKYWKNLPPDWVGKY